MKFDNLLYSQEDKLLEFKLPSPKNIMKTMATFANTAGSIMLIDVEDDHTVIGVNSNPLDQEEQLSNMITDSIVPRLIPNIELISSNDLTLLAVEVFPNQQRPHYLKQKGEQHGFFVRLGSTNRQAGLPLVEELKRTVTVKGLDKLPLLDADADDIDFQALKEAFNTARKLVPTVGGILLFDWRGDHFSPNAWIQRDRFIGTEKIDIFDPIDINFLLPNAIGEIMLFLKKYATILGTNFSEIRKINFWSIPLTILWEAVIIINAIIHADDSQHGAPIRIVFSLMIGLKSKIPVYSCLDWSLMT